MVKRRLLTKEEKQFLELTIKYGYAASFANYGIRLTDGGVYLNFYAKLKDGMIVREWSIEIGGVHDIFKGLKVGEYYTWEDLGIKWE